MHDQLRTVYIIFISLLVSFASGCSSIGYYLQSVQGELEILQKSRPIDILLEEKQLPQQLLDKLEQASDIRRFAIKELHLPDNNSYRQYADLKREYVVWNVFAAPELSTGSKYWCYLIVGCLGYRGYFSKNAAIQFADNLEKQGYDVYVGGVTAFSTLGWLADPLLNTMLHRDVTDLAKVIFHELAHQKIYIRNDTEFNEAFADTVAIEGVDRWLQQGKDPDLTRKFRLNQEREEIFVNLVINYRQRLGELYRSELPEYEKRIQKAHILQLMIDDYHKVRNTWEDGITYDTWFALGVNNAKLNAVSTYREYVPGFQKLLRSVDNNLDSFYELVKSLGKCPEEERRKILLYGAAASSCQYIHENDKHG